jgi:hypothetical protein
MTVSSDRLRFINRRAGTSWLILSLPFLKTPAHPPALSGCRENFGLASEFSRLVLGFADFSMFLLHEKQRIEIQGSR